MKKISPLSTGRFFKTKNHVKKFLCALCKAPRSMRYTKYLGKIKYLQILLISIGISWAAFPFIGAKSVFAVFLVWTAFEVTNKLLYRKEIACPYCGFDATWYRRDVTVANQKVKDYWLNNYPDLVNPPEIDPEELGNNGVEPAPNADDAYGQTPII